MINSIEALRKFLLDYYGTAMQNGNPMAVIKLTEVETASPEKLVKLAQELGISIS